MRLFLVGGIVLGSLIGVVGLPLRAAAAPAAASLDKNRFPAASPSETLLHVGSPGRFAISAHSASGTALDLVDMITGPTPEAGTPGSLDGRLDALLDTGTYKIRLHPAAGAQGDVQLSVAPFQNAAPPALMPSNTRADTTLADLQQRSYWFSVTDATPVRLEAAGRALADFRLWRDGRDLVATSPTTRIIEPSHGRPLRDILIQGSLPPGTYLATVYGGPALPWADGSPDLPFHLREGAPDTLRPGWTGGQIGPFGSEVFRAAGRDNLFRLAAEGPATLAVDGNEGTIDIKSRIQAVEVPAANRQADHWVEVSAASGTPYQLRAERIGTGTSLYGTGTYFVTVNTNGLGGDDVPATLILARSSEHGWSVAGSNAPAIGPHNAWHHRFNLGGQVSVLFHATVGGRIAARVGGIRLEQLDLTALDALANHPPERPEAPGTWNVPAGWYALTLAPAGNTQGVADVTIGPPGLEVPLAPPSPPAPSITFGVQSLAWKETLQVFGNAAPNSNIELDARSTPVELSQGPLRLSQAPGEATDIPIQPDAGASTLTALEYAGGPVPVAYDPASGIARLPPSDHPRMVALSWAKSVPTPVMPVPEPEAARATLRDGVTRFFDLAENEYRGFNLTVGAGGLFRVETLGRLHTGGRIGSRFVPELERADGNGIGQNMLLAGFLRAGQYHVDVAAVESAGHAGILASPAPLLTTPALLPGGSVRTTMQAGAGLVIPITIAQTGQYRIDLLGLARSFDARLEDEQGWPFAASAPFDTSTEDLQAGHYRLEVSPNATTARAVARLTRIETPPPLSGHGPHPLPFDAPQAFIWREPAGRTDKRVPDLWNFTLAAPADVTLSITDGMEATLHAPGGEVAAHIIGDAPFTGRLKEGAYTVQATSQGRNDRLDYTLSLTAPQLQPGVPRSVDLPSSVSFALATDRVVSLTSFGATPVRATLKDGDGHVLGRFGGRNNDWNLAVSQLLPVGDYTLDLASAAPPPLHPAPANVNDRPGAGSPQPGDAEDPGNGPEPQQTSQGDAPESAQPAAPPPDDGNGGPPPSNTELNLSLPAELPPVNIPEGAVTLVGGGVHRLLIPAATPGQLILAGASSPAELVLSLEQQAGGVWRNRALAQGLAPIVALPPDASPGAWRLSVWAVDGGTLPTRLAVRIINSPAHPGQPVLFGTALPGIDAKLAVDHLALASRNLLALSAPLATSGGAGQGVLAAAWRGHPATVPDAGMIAPQDDDLWLIATQAGPLALSPLPPGSPVTVTLQGNVRAVLPAASDNFATAWIAEAPGQPGLDSGHGMGIADGSTFALATQQSPSLWNAGEDADTLRVTAHPVALADAPAQTFDSRPSWLLPGATATVLRLPRGLHAWRLDLPPGTAAVAGWPNPKAVVAWAGRSALSRTLQGDWDTLLLVNTNQAPAPVGVAIVAPSAMATLDPTHAARQFFGASGSIDLAVSASNGQTLVVAGDASATFLGSDGTVRRGSQLRMTGPGRVILEHGAGPVAAWLEGPGAAPWPTPKPIAVSLPASLPLSGPAMQLRLAPSQPTLLRIRSSAPLILSVNGAQPVICPTGAAVSRYLPAGPAKLDIIAPQDGDLSGSLELTTAPIRPAVDGLSDPVTVSPGDAALFAFDLARPTRIGLAIKAEPDDATLALLDSAGHELATGAALLRDLPTGHYILSASVPHTAPTTVLRAAILGIKPRPNGPPPDVIHFYRELAGLTAPANAAPKDIAP
jgi:hypothetical protein